MRIRRPLGALLAALTLTAVLGALAGPAGSTANPTLERLSGPDRIDTAIAVSKKAFPNADSAQSVVLARWDDFPDALAGGVLAAAKDGPVLLTQTQSLDPRTLGEIDRVLPAGATVYLLGGTAALSPAVESAVQAAGYTPVRYGGATRYDTAVIIANQGLGGGGPIFLVDGITFQGAIVAAPAGVATGGKLLLTDGTSLPAPTAGYLAANAGETLYGVGVASAIPQPGLVPLGNADPYVTSQAVAQQFFPTPTVVAIASGVVFADGLAGGALMGPLNGPVLLTLPSPDLPQTTTEYLNLHADTISLVYVLGGTAAVSQAVADAALLAVTLLT